jgi:hypothetical protein
MWLTQNPNRARAKPKFNRGATVLQVAFVTRLLSLTGWQKDLETYRGFDDYECGR